LRKKAFRTLLGLGDDAPLALLRDSCPGQVSDRIMVGGFNLLHLEIAVRVQCSAFSLIFLADRCLLTAKRFLLCMVITFERGGITGLTPGASASRPRAWFSACRKIESTARSSEKKG
jgi:hypothetical protein